MKVYVVYYDMDYDGYSLPAKVFSSRETCEEWCRDHNKDAKPINDWAEYECLEVE